MFDVGFWELVVLFGLGLMVLGPERLPKVASQIGRWAGQARRMARNLTTQIRAEIEPIETSVQSMEQSVRKDFSALRPEPGQTAVPHTETAPGEIAGNADPGQSGSDSDKPATRDPQA